MTGPEHYAKAERLLVRLQRGDLSPLHELTAEQAVSAMALTAAEAQVHATLASAAATVGTSDYAAWCAVAGKPKEAGQ